MIQLIANTAQHKHHKSGRESVSCSPVPPPDKLQVTEGVAEEGSDKGF